MNKIQYILCTTLYRDGGSRNIRIVIIKRTTNHLRNGHKVLETELDFRFTVQWKLSETLNILTWMNALLQVYTRTLHPIRFKRIPYIIIPYSNK